MSNLDEKWMARIMESSTPTDPTKKANPTGKVKEALSGVDFEKGLEVTAKIVEDMVWTKTIKPIVDLSFLAAQGVKTTYDIGADPERTYKESMTQFGKSSEAYLGEQAVQIKKLNDEFAKARQPYKEQFEKKQISLQEYIAKDLEVSKKYGEKLIEISAVQGTITGVEVAATLIATKAFGGVPAMVGYGAYNVGKVMMNKNLTPEEKLIQGSGSAGSALIWAGLFNLGQSAVTLEKSGKVALDSTKLKNLQAARSNGTITELDNYMLGTLEKYANSQGVKVEKLAGKKLDLNEINKLVPDEVIQRGNFEVLKDMKTKSISRLINKSEVKPTDTQEEILKKITASNKLLKTEKARFSDEDLQLIAKGIEADPKFRLQKAVGDLDASLDNPSVYGKSLMKEGTPAKLFDEALTSPMSFWIKLDGKGNPAKLALDGKQTGGFYNTIGRATIDAENRSGQAIRASEDYTKGIADFIKRSKSPAKVSIQDTTMNKEQVLKALLLYTDPRNKMVGRSMNVYLGNGKTITLSSKELQSLAKQYPELQETASTLAQKNSVIGRMVSKADLEKTGKPVVLADEYLVKREFVSKGSKRSYAAQKLDSLKDELEEIKTGSKKILTPGTLKKAADEIPDTAVFDLSKGLIRTIRSHDEDVAAYIKAAPTIPVYKNIVALKERLVSKFGDAGYQRIIANMDKSFLTPELAGFASDKGLTNIANKVTSNIIGSKLGNKPIKLGLIQVTQLSPIANVTGWKNTIGALRQLEKQPELLSYIMAKSKVFNNRYNSVGLEDYLNSSFGSEALKNAKRIPLIGMQAMDKNMAAISWLSAKNKALQIKGMTVKGAEAIADDVLLMTQPQTMVATRSAMETTPVLKYAMLFKTQQKQMLDRTVESLSAMRNAPKGQKLKFIKETGKDVFYNQTLPAVIATAIDSMFISGAVRNEDDPVGYEEQLIRQTKQSSLGTIPVLGDILYAMSEDGRSSKYELDNPLLRAISDIVDAMDKSGKSLTEFVQGDGELETALVDLTKITAQLISASVGGNINPLIDPAAALTDVRLGEQTAEWSRILGIKPNAKDRKNEAVSDDPVVNALRMY